MSRQAKPRKYHVAGRYGYSAVDYSQGVDDSGSAVAITGITKKNANIICGQLNSAQHNGMMTALGFRKPTEVQIQALADIYYETDVKLRADTKKRLHSKQLIEINYVGKVTLSTFGVAVLMKWGE